MQYSWITVFFVGLCPREGALPLRPSEPVAKWGLCSDGTDLNFTVFIFLSKMSFEFRSEAWLGKLILEKGAEPPSPLRPPNEAKWLCGSEAGASRMRKQNRNEKTRMRKQNRNKSLSIQNWFSSQVSLRISKLTFDKIYNLCKNTSIETKVSQSKIDFPAKSHFEYSKLIFDKIINILKFRSIPLQRSPHFAAAPFTRLSRCSTWLRRTACALGINLQKAQHFI